MGFFKEAGESLLNISERFLDKTEELAQIAKLTMEIKKMEHSIEDNYKTIGRHVYDSVANGNEMIHPDGVIRDTAEQIQNYKTQIVDKQEQIQKVKQSYASKHRY